MPTGPLRLATANVNGIRAAVRRGFAGWLAARNPDVLCLQEVRAGESDVPTGVFSGYHLSYHEGGQKGRAGVAVLTRTAPTDVRVGFGSAEFDVQGRYLEVDLDVPGPGGARRLTVASLYLPKGAASGEVLDTKLRFMRQFAEHARDRAARAETEGGGYLVAGDFNIAPTQDDLKAWKTNQRSPGFLPVEREWFSALLAPGAAGEATGDPGLVDVLRRLHPDQPGPYTWWSWRGRQFDNDAGWRIDLQLASPTLAAAAAAGGVDREASYEARMSDHSPVWADYAWPGV